MNLYSNEIIELLQQLDGNHVLLGKGKNKFTVNMLLQESKILATNSIYCSVAHKESVIKKYLYNLRGVFELISELEKMNSLPEKYIFKKNLIKFDRLN